MAKAAMSVSEAARELNVHPETLRRKILSGEGPAAVILPGVRRTIRILPKDWERWLRERTIGRER